MARSFKSTWDPTVTSRNPVGEVQTGLATSGMKAPTDALTDTVPARVWASGEESSKAIGTQNYGIQLASIESGLLRNTARQIKNVIPRDAAAIDAWVVSGAASTPAGWFLLHGGDVVSPSRADSGRQDAELRAD